MRYFETFLPELAKLSLPLQLSYEVKANLRKPQVALLAQAGIREIQPGIESLSSHLFRLMRKGVRGLQYVQLLKWCAEKDVRVYWNLLQGFPGERVEDYLQLVKWAALLPHLDPPLGVGRIRLDRFSPRFDAPHAHGFTDVRPAPAYAVNYPTLDEAGLHNIAYFFEYGLIEACIAHEHLDAVINAADNWRKSRKQAQLAHVLINGGILVLDLRTPDTDTCHILSGLDAEIFRACDAAQTPSAFAKACDAQLSDVRASLAGLLDHGLMIVEDDCYLAVSVEIEASRIQSSPRMLAALAAHVQSRTPVSA